MFLQKTTFLSAITAFNTLFAFIIILLPHWMNVEDYGDVGAFERNRGGDKLYNSDCGSSMSDTECGYLVSLQISAALVIVFGVFSAFFFYIPPKAINSLPGFLGTVGLYFQFIFGLIVCVLFHYFQENYITDDGVNREYGDNPDVTQEFAYPLWILTTVVHFVLAMVATYASVNTGYHPKGVL